MRAVSSEQATRNAQTAFDRGADGVFLINHHIGMRDSLDIHVQVAVERPGRWIGVNLLGLRPHDTSRMLNDGVRAFVPARAVIEGRPETGLP
jgi:hypothetical protein